MKLYKNQSVTGAVLIVLALVVIAGIIAAGIYVVQNKDGDSQKPSNQTVEPSNTTTTTEPSISDNLEQKPYENSAEGVKINIPKGWKVYNKSIKGPGTIALFESPDPTKTSANIFVSIDYESKFKLDELVNASIDVLKEEPQYTLISKEKLEVNSNEARLIEGVYGQKDKDSYAYQLIIVKNSKSYLLTGSVTGNSSDKYKELLRESILTFQVN